MAAVTVSKTIVGQTFGQRHLRRGERQHNVLRNTTGISRQPSG